MDKPAVSIIIVNYNGGDFIVDCIDSVVKSHLENIEIIVVDNCSTDNSLEMLRRRFNDSRILLIENKENLGFARANNLGYKNSKGDYLALLNVDTIVDGNWLTEILSAMESEPSIGAAQPKLLKLDDHTLYDSTGDFIDFYGFSYRRGGEWEEIDQGQYDTKIEIFSARGAALVTRKKLIDRIGLFDESLFMSYEDIDLCWRILLSGRRVIFVPSSIVYHKGSGIISRQSPRISMHVSKNRYLCLLKNFDRINVIKFALFPLLVEICSGFFIWQPFIMRNDHKIIRIRGKLLAYYWILRNSSRIIESRRFVQKDVRKVPDSFIMIRMIHTSPVQMLRLIVNSIRYGKTAASQNYVNKQLKSR